MGRIYRFYTNERLNDVQIDYLKNELVIEQPPPNKKIIAEVRNLYTGEPTTTFDVVIESDPDNTSGSEENWYKKILEDIDKGINERRLVTEIIYTTENTSLKEAGKNNKKIKFPKKPKPSE
jgi:hypothetical protein